MSRTKKGAKGGGSELWGKRRGSGFPCGRVGKKMAHGQERADAKQDLSKQPRTPEYDPRGYVERCDDPECRECNYNGQES